MVKLPPPLWLAIFLVLGGAVSALYPWRALLDVRFMWLGVALIVAGLAISAWAVLIFRRVGTELNPTAKTSKVFVIRGPFRLTRNPMYLGLVVLSLGIAFCVGSLPMFAVPVLVFVTANWIHIPFEEAKMRRQFGGAFENYQKRVRRWI